jgi:hypothetical protein
VEYPELDMVRLEPITAQLLCEVRRSTNDKPIARLECPSTAELLREVRRRTGLGVH